MIAKYSTFALMMLVSTVMCVNQNCNYEFADKEKKINFRFKKETDKQLHQNIKVLDDSKNVDDKVYYNICSKTKIPKECKNDIKKGEEKNAKFVVVPGDNSGKCIILNNKDDWKFDITEKKPFDEVAVRLKSDDDYSIVYNFVC